jgi:hypothetical protein
MQLWCGVRPCHARPSSQLPSPCAHEQAPTLARADVSCTSYPRHTQPAVSVHARPCVCVHAQAWCRRPVLPSAPAAQRCCSAGWKLHAWQTDIFRGCRASRKRSQHCTGSLTSSLPTRVSKRHTCCFAPAASASRCVLPPSQPPASAASVAAAGWRPLCSPRRHPPRPARTARTHGCLDGG